MSVDAPAAPALAPLVERLAAHPSFQEVVAALRSGRSGTLDGVWGSSCALAAAALHVSAPSCLVVVAPHLADAEGVASDLAAFTAATPRAFGAVAPSFGEGAGYDADSAGRLRVLRELVNGVPPRLIVAPIAGLLQKTPHPETIAANRRTFRVGDRAEPEDVAAALVELSFSATTAVEAPGEFSLRGGILDVFAADADEPLRIEFFGDEIASLRRFSVATQRSSEVVDSAQILAVTAAVGAGATLFDFLPPDAWLMLIEPQAAEEEAKHVIRTAPEKESILGYDVAWRRLCEHPSVTASSVAVGSMETTCRLPIETVERFSGDLQKVRDELDAVGGGQRVCIMCESDGEAERLGEVFSSTTLAAERRLELHVAPIRSGFRFVSEQVAVLSAAEMFHRDARRGTAGRRLGRAIDSFVDLRAGDLVVHVGHGVARYLGMKLLDKGGQVEEHLELEFAGGVKLFVPATSISLVQKYVGGSKARPKLAKLGGAAWGRHKKAAADAVADMAADLLELQARRTSASGIAFSTDSSWQDDFDALFPFDLTADQAAAVEATRADMQTARPMDRLICGDVGFGKTEVAMRAAFRAVDSGYQVAVLAPTTILVEQHYRTFSQRMAEFPFTVAALSRFSSRKQQKQVVESAATGGVDIVIGTHRLVQADVRFRNLGLIIIDEEQRFGVEVKERLKAIRSAVDVLTLTATPIPRTLHMSLLGIRDISNLETAPEGRMPIETKVCRFDRDLIRHAALRELQRGGQIYFVHNRIHDIGEVQTRLEQILPEARIAVAHGQMPEGELEEIVLGFVAGDFDLLLATTIVESGLDIPNANTMFINEADRYGLAEMHQLRGRVGRSTHRAFCYLLIDENKHLNPEAAKRLRAIEEFHAIGAGFAIAMRDLEIRGAGNILGSEQSGHISAVGYELYCTLLEQAVRRLKQLPEPPTAEAFIDLPGEAYLPRSYVPDLRQKVDLYRRLSRVGSHEELGELLQEMEDRFGPPPAPVRRLQMLAELRITVAGWGVRGVRLEEEFVVLEYRRAELIQRLKHELRGALRIVDEESAYLPLKHVSLDGSDVATALKSLLPPAPPAP